MLGEQNLFRGNNLEPGPCLDSAQTFLATERACPTLTVLPIPKLSSHWARMPDAPSDRPPVTKWLKQLWASTQHFLSVGPTKMYRLHLLTNSQPRSTGNGGGWMICHFSNIQVHFVFCQLNFIVLFSFLINYYHILFIIIVFRLASHRLVSCFFYCLSQGTSHGMWLLAWGRVDDSSFSIIQVHFVFC